MVHFDECFLVIWHIICFMRDRVESILQRITLSIRPVLDRFGSVWVGPTYAWYRGRPWLHLDQSPAPITNNYGDAAPVYLPTKLRIRFRNPPFSSSSSSGDQRRRVLEDGRRPAAVDSRRSTRATFAGRKDAWVADAHLRYHCFVCLLLEARVSGSILSSLWQC